MKTEILLCMATDIQSLIDLISFESSIECSIIDPLSEQKIEFYILTTNNKDLPEYAKRMVRGSISPTYAGLIAKKTRNIKDYIEEHYELMNIIPEHTKHEDSEKTIIKDNLEIDFLKGEYAFNNRVTITNTMELSGNPQSPDIYSIFVEIESKIPDEDHRDIQDYFLKYGDIYPEFFLIKHITKRDEQNYVYYENALSSWFTEQHLKNNLKEVCYYLDKKTPILYDSFRIKFEKFTPR